MSPGSKSTCNISCSGYFNVKAKLKVFICFLHCWVYGNGFGLGKKFGKKLVKTSQIGPDSSFNANGDVS